MTSASGSTNPENPDLIRLAESDVVYEETRFDQLVVPDRKRSDHQVNPDRNRLDLPEDPDENQADDVESDRQRNVFQVFKYYLIQFIYFKFIFGRCSLKLFLGIY